MDFIGKSPVPIPVLVIGKLAFLGCSLFPLLNPGPVLYDTPFTRILGLALYGGGFAMVIFSLVHLGSSVAVGIPERETQLKTHGLYRISRNPIYVGGFAMCAGSCLHSAHILNFLLFAIAIAVHMRIISREEVFLEERFGQKWLDYKRRVPRFLGRVR